jgi:quercetin dioxygenase-like cupin family protein
MEHSSKIKEGGRYRHFVLANVREIETLEPGIKRQLLGYGDNIMAARVWFEKGAVGDIHAHPHSQVSYVESGSFEVSIDGEKQVLSVGDSFFAPPNIDHGAVCLESGVLIDMFSPMRDDFLPQKDSK